MTMFRIEAGGQSYRVDAPTPEAAAQAVEEMLRSGGGGGGGSGPPPSAPSGIGEAVGPVLQGVTGGLVHDIVGGIGGIGSAMQGGSFGEGYAAGRDKSLKRVQKFTEENPIAGTALEIGGALATIPVTGPLNVVRAPAAVSKAAPLVERGINALTRGAATTANAAATGAGYGALYGAGTAAGDVADRVHGALEGGAIGGTLGALAPAAVGLVKGGAKAIGAALGHPIQAGRAAMAPASRAEQLVHEAATQDLTQPQRGVGVLQAAQAAGAPMAPIDFGPASRNLGRNVKNISPEAEGTLGTFIGDRAAEQGARTIDAITARAPGVNSPQTRTVLEASARAANKPAYDRAYRDGAAGVWNRELEQLTLSPAMQRAIKDATATGANKAAVEGARPPPNPFVQNKDGTLSLAPGVTPNLRFWDAVKQNLDSAIGTAKRSGDDPLVRDLTRLKQELVRNLDTVVPSYKAAREGAAGFFGAENALDAGEAFVTSRLGNQEAREAVAKMTPAERQLFAEGFATGLVRQVHENPANRNVLNSRIFASPAARERIEIALGPQTAREMEAFLLGESVMNMARTVVSGHSTTAMQILGNAALSGGTGLWMSGGNFDATALITAMLTGTAIRGGRNISHGVQAKVAREVAELLVSQDPQSLQKVVDRVSRNPSLLAAFRSMHDQFTRALTPVTVPGGGAGIAPAFTQGGPEPAQAEDRQ